MDMVPVLTIDDGFDEVVPGRWEIDTHPLGRGSVRADNVAVGGGRAVLTLPAGCFDGAEIRSAGKAGFGTYSARMMTPRAPGSLSAFFLYQGGSDVADELDVEIFNDGSRRVMFTTWVAGETTNTATVTLPFDPAAGVHEYGIGWTPDVVSFAVDGAVMQEWREGIPRNPMFVMANAWWPVWMDAAPPESARALVIERMRGDSVHLRYI